MKLDGLIREAENQLFNGLGLAIDESYVDLPNVGVRLRVLSAGAGPPLVMLHGVTLSAAVWAPWLADIPGYRTHLVELPGHGLSGPFAYRGGSVRDDVLAIMDDLFDTLDLPHAPVVAHSLGGMFALWYAAARPGRIESLVAIGAPAVALPGTRVAMPLSLLTVPVLGEAVLRSPMPRSSYRRLLGQGLGGTAAATAPDDLVDVLRLSARRPGNAHTIASLMHAINGFRRPRSHSPLSDDELASISTPTIFCWGKEDPIMKPDQARCSIATIPTAALHEVAGGHAPWLDDPVACAQVVVEHLASTGLAPRLT